MTSEVMSSPRAGATLSNVHSEELPPVGKQLRHWRTTRGLSQLALAEMAEVSTRHLSFIETGKSSVVENITHDLAARYDPIVIVATNEHALLTVQQLLHRAELLLPQRITILLRDAGLKESTAFQVKGDKADPRAA